jgi:hypothetical protein
MEEEPPTARRGATRLLAHGDPATSYVSISGDLTTTGVLRPYVGGIDVTPEIG